MIRKKMLFTESGAKELVEELTSRGFTVVEYRDQDALLGYYEVCSEEGKYAPIYDYETLVNMRAEQYQDENGVSDEDAFEDAYDNVSFNMSFGSQQGELVIDYSGLHRSTNFAEYQVNAQKTAQLSEDLSMLANWGLGLTGEAGEVVELIKKHLYHGKELNKDDLAKELGDVLWYVSTIATQCGLSLDEIADKNIHKLFSRYPNGFVKGGGKRD